MKTLLDATRVTEDGRWSLMYAKDYPVSEGDEVKFYPLLMIDTEKGKLGYDNGVEVVELKTEKKEVILTKNEEERFVDLLKWKKIVFENGDAMIVPPNVEEATNV